jgi:hypothetical protein
MIYDAVTFEQREGYIGVNVINPVIGKRTDYMQFTGLHDKNGKEIYEGDILKTDDNILKVGWSKQYASFCLSKKEWLYNHYFGEAVEPEQTEVIGNIYKTPELWK